MASDRDLRINPVEAFQQKVMRQVALQLSDTPYVLKGGAALIFTRGLPRHSTDLDFDSQKKLNIQNRILSGLKAAGVQADRIKMVKDTETVQRFKIHYRDPQTQRDVLFKVETSFRQSPDPQEVEVIDGIRTYNVRRMFDDKMNASIDRTEARDLYDLGYLVKNYGDQLSDSQIQRIDHFSKNLDLLATRYKESLENDDVLMRVTDVTDTVIQLRESVEVQLTHRATKIQSIQWDKLIAQGVSKMLDYCGNRHEDGSVSFATKEYNYLRDRSGEIQVRPKDGRPVLTPKTLSDRDIQVMSAIADKMTEIEQSARKQQSQQKPEKKQQRRRKL